MLRGSLLVLTLAGAGCGGPESLETTTDAVRPPAWMGEAKYAITRATCGTSVCSGDLHPLAGGFRYDSWADQRAAITRGYFEVWQPGVTDWNNPDLWRQLDVRIHYRVDPNASFEWRWVGFLERAGNNARYAFSLRELDPFFDPSQNSRPPIQQPSECPSFPFRLGSDGHSLEADVELYLSVNGAELRPAPGATFRGTYAHTPAVVGLCTPAAPQVIDRSGRDVTVLQAWFGDRVTTAVQAPGAGGLRFDPNLCAGTDCTDAVRAIAGGSPFVNRFIYPGPSAGLCELIEIRTVTRNGAVSAPTFAGIGFWFSGAFSFVPGTELHPVGNVVLRDGSPAVVHRFLAQGMCFGQGGNSGSIQERRFEFKPFARFDVPGEQYRIWDDVSQNYLLGRTRSAAYGFVSSFDRQGELLAP